MLTGIKAFEARWQATKGDWNIRESRLLMQAMSRLVDNYATYEEIEEELPVSLQGAFSRLVDAYLNGFWLEDEDSYKHPTAVLSPAMLAAQQLRQHTWSDRSLACLSTRTLLLHLYRRPDGIDLARLQELQRARASILTVYEWQ